MLNKKFLTGSRVFIAINLPEEVKAELEDIKQGIVGFFPDGAGREIAKWVKKDNLHITLLFVGNVENERIIEICGKVKQTVVNQQSFKLKINKIGLGAKEKGVPRLIWAEIENNKNLQKIAASLGCLNFKAHITLARIRAWQWKQIDPEEMPSFEQDLDIKFEVKSIDIMESKLKRTGPEYSVLKSFFV